MPGPNATKFADENMEILSTYYPPSTIRYVEKLVEMGFFPNRSEAFRYAAVNLLLEFKILLRNEL